MKKLLQKIWNGVKNLFQKTSEIAVKVIPVAVEIVEGLKQATDSGIIEMPLYLFKKLIKGEADDVLIDKGYRWWKNNMQSVIDSLNTVYELSQIKDNNERLIAILRYYQTATSNEQAKFYSGLSADAAVALSDGKLTLVEGFKLSKELYDHIKNSK